MGIFVSPIEAKFLSAAAGIFNYMALTKERKKKIIEDLIEKIKKKKALIFVNFSGLKVKDLSELRKELKKVSSEFKVAKKTLLNLALKEKKLKIEPKKLIGEIALVFGYKDEISPAKVVYNFSKTNPNLKILGGFIEDKYQEAEEIIGLAQLPTREELLTELLGSISAPISNFINVLRANLKNFVYILSQIKVNQQN
ncbi:MAG: 50S ribosomal protein L10 [Patescibacteria group bacterium]|nr:50S ribosomal protein L10 [Patescibacteria group bacterium]